MRTLYREGGVKDDSLFQCVLGACQCSDNPESLLACLSFRVVRKLTLRTNNYDTAIDSDGRPRFRDTAKRILAFVGVDV